MKLEGWEMLEPTIPLPIAGCMRVYELSRPYWLASI